MRTSFRITSSTKRPAKQSKPGTMSPQGKFCQTIGKIKLDQKAVQLFLEFGGPFEDAVGSFHCLQFVADETAERGAVFR